MKVSKNYILCMEIYLKQINFKELMKEGILTEIYRRSNEIVDRHFLDTQQNVDYFNQLIETDSYIREVSEILKTLYNIPKEGIEPFQSGLVTVIINDIKNGKVKDEDVQQITNIYWDPRINKKAKMKFFGTLYEYLYGEES